MNILIQSQGTVAFICDMLYQNQSDDATAHSVKFTFSVFWLTLSVYFNPNHDHFLNLTK